MSAPIRGAVVDLVGLVEVVDEDGALERTALGQFLARDVEGKRPSSVDLPAVDHRVGDGLVDRRPRAAEVVPAGVADPTLFDRRDDLRVNAQGRCGVRVHPPQVVDGVACLRVPAAGSPFLVGGRRGKTPLVEAGFARTGQTLLLGLVLDFDLQKRGHGQAQAQPVELGERVADALLDGLVLFGIHPPHLGDGCVSVERERRVGLSRREQLLELTDLVAMRRAVQTNESLHDSLGLLQHLASQRSHRSEVLRRTGLNTSPVVEGHLQGRIDASGRVSGQLRRRRTVLRDLVEECLHLVVADRRQVIRRPAVGGRVGIHELLGGAQADVGSPDVGPVLLLSGRRLPGVVDAQVVFGPHLGERTVDIPQRRRLADERVGVDLPGQSRGDTDNETHRVSRCRAVFGGTRLKPSLYYTIFITFSTIA